MPQKQKCRICGCTEDHGCPSGCYWVEHDLCSKCAERIQTDVNFITHMAFQKVIEFLNNEGFTDAAEAVYNEFGL